MKQNKIERKRVRERGTKKKMESCDLFQEKKKQIGNQFKSWNEK